MTPDLLPLSWLNLLKRLRHTSSTPPDTFLTPSNLHAGQREEQRMPTSSSFIWCTCIWRTVKPMCVSCSQISPQHLTQSIHWFLADRLRGDFRFDAMLFTWITKFLNDRSQQVGVGNTLSEVCTTSVGTPQGSVLSPVLFILYTDSWRSRFLGRHLIKYADDTLVGLLERDKTEHGPALNDFNVWC